MKKTVFLLTVIFLLLALTGCTLLQYASMGTMAAEELLRLSDEDLVVAVSLRFISDDFEQLNDIQKTVYTAAMLEMEVLNGGMVQFLSNEGAYCAPYVCQALENLGAEEHLQLLQEALEENNVDLNDLSDFITEDLEVFSALYDRYNFDSYDNAYISLPSMTEYLRTYIQANSNALD